MRFLTHPFLAPFYNEVYVSLSEHISIQEFTFETSDKISLSGAIATPQNPIGSALFLRGGYGVEFGLFMDVLFAQSSLFYQFASAGYTTYALDYSGTGHSQGGESHNGADQIQDICELLEYISIHNDGKRLLIGGHSRGADAALLATNLYSGKINGLIALSGLYDLTQLHVQRPDLYGKITAGVQNAKQFLMERSITHQAIAKLNSVPILLAHGKKDERSPVQNAQLVKAYLLSQPRNSPLNFQLYEHGGHTINKPWVEMLEKIILDEYKL
jgi:dipeptidyl aminopeptidase/acylaminoacyl peptidase